MTSLEPLAHLRKMLADSTTDCTTNDDRTKTGMTAAPAPFFGDAFDFALAFGALGDFDRCDELAEDCDDLDLSLDADLDRDRAAS